MQPRPDITSILEELARGDDSAANRLLPEVYDELRALASVYFKQQDTDHTLQPTALVHEAYVRLVSSDSDWSGRKHFFDVAAMAMRQLLADHARRKGAAKRGGSAHRVDLEIASGSAGARLEVDLIALDDALRTLASLDPRQARIVELRFLAGLTIEETAEVLGVSSRTVNVDWQMARAWLTRELAETT